MSQINVNTIANASGTSAASIDSNGIFTPTKIAQTIAFQVKGNNSDMAYTASNGQTVITGWNVTDLNVGNCWSTANSRFTPTVAGWYMFGGSVRGNFSGILQVVATEITKNGQKNVGVGLKTQFQFNADVISNGEIPMATGMIYCDGVDDYVEVWLDADENCTIHDGTSRSSHFFGFLVHAT